MTPEQERALLDATAKGLDDDLRQAYQDLIQLIRDGVEPRDAVQQVMESFSKEYAQLLSTAFSGVMAMSVGTEAALAMEVGTVQLSAKLYAQSATVGQVVQGIADKHLKGFSDARALALQLFEGYGFRDPAAEPLQFNPSNPTLPKYLREALLSDSGMQGEMTRAFAKLQVDGLKSEALRAAYKQVLDALDKVQQGAGQDLLDKRLKTAFFERMRYFANRIVQTEIHKAYMKREAQLLMDDEECEFVQIRRNPKSDSVCICTLYAGRDRYGMGKGVYPKRAAPVPPFHPHCLTGDALITSAGRIAAVSKRWFDGDVVVITTASGKRLASTVNHPILTRDGWVSAGLLNLGDDVVSRVDSVPVGRNALSNDDHQNMPSRISEIADAFLCSGEVSAREVPVSAEDFHGDGMGSDVAVIGADRKLWDRVDSAASEVADNHLLDFASPRLAGLFGKGVLHLGSEALWNSPDCVVCGGRQSEPLFSREERHSDEGLFAGGTLSDPISGQPEINDVTADTELCREIENGSTGPVFFDNVVIIERVAYSGHVYNLETDQGHYTANGIITHNCKCILSPRLDLTGRTAKPENPESDRYFLHSLGAPMAAQVVGSQDKLERVLRSGDATQVYNAGIPSAYQVQTVGQVTKP